MPNDPRALLRAAIDRSGLSHRRFAERIMVRDERTVRRWISGEIPIPTVVLDKLQSLIDQPDLGMESDT